MVSNLLPGFIIKIFVFSLLKVISGFFIVNQKIAKLSRGCER